MNAQQLRQTFLNYFRTHQHALIGSASLIPEHDPSVLFTTAGMHPLVTFLLGEPHPAGRRLANYQKCVRTNDITEVGDVTHLTFFEMLGNWSLGDYWKADSIQFSYVFLTAHLGLDAERLHVTCFVGDTDSPRDNEAVAIWQSLGIPPQRITLLPKADNWWGPAGTTGPCGPDSEIFYDTNPDGPPEETPATNSQRFWEIWNNVFIMYNLDANGNYGTLTQRNIDTGMGLERTLAVLQGVSSPYETDLFVPIIEHIHALAHNPQLFAVRIIADHIRAATAILAEGIEPGNVDQPYVARRLIRRAVRYGREISINGHFLGKLAETTISTLADAYPEFEQQRDHICTALDQEEIRFERTLARGQKMFAKAVETCRRQAGSIIPGEVVFNLYDTYGFPAELTEELAAQHGLIVDMDGFRSAFAAHQERSRQSTGGRFQGGLTDHGHETTQLHTATHLLHEALRRVLGPHVEQRGSNITTERLRFDFSHSDKLNREQITEVEQLVNDTIQQQLPVTWAEMSLGEARQSNAIGLFGERYGERVKVYRIGDFSTEICGGPHVAHTGELGAFRITKESAVGSGVRRIRAVLETTSEIDV
ncbi:MAG: alanine--tRNA ligase [Chloroflexi bacterium AL-W]|nr:alanine--tRNA ligase [Chloroflexi bacterium AL-N1]NOK65530.1 alanine--tRNA ligase [Chloroflexi bacterium AL-N10]NOK74528.1 alanine--tRNA ligase [Chloroflexi bacterium AL-N5]NOK80563.1 alanine--tRNA ligase [Chloroflexi bacterium AL-W]NOK88786.1 alanine--tRNA ligase [Chloroflexi bacterium AL-N15]